MQAMTRDEALRRVVFLKDAPEAALAALRQAGVVLTLTEGELLFLEAESSRGLLVVLEGALKESKTDARGRELILAIHKPGASVAELPLFDGGNHPTQAVALESPTRIFCVARPAFEAILERYPMLAHSALRALAIQQRKLLEMLKAQALHTVRSRLVAYLLAQDTPSFTLPETNESIAAQVGTVREVISRTLHQLADLGHIALTGRTVTVLNRAALEKIAAGE
jgi:CRP/FNR family transcriptional regulator, dissimilatory nitrate respiration regulator